MSLLMGILEQSAVVVDPGPEPSVYPTLAARSHDDASGSTSRSITLPSPITAGQRIVLVIALESPATITGFPGGYTQVSGQTVFHKTAIGTEDGTSVTFTVSSGFAFSNHAAFVFNNATQVAASAPVTASTANANCPSLTVPWGADNNLFMAIYFGMAPGNSITGYPANCPLYHHEDEAGIDEYHAGAESLLATFNPDAFTTGANDHKLYTLGLGP